MQIFNIVSVCKIYRDKGVNFIPFLFTILILLFILAIICFHFFIPYQVESQNIIISFNQLFLSVLIFLFIKIFRLFQQKLTYAEKEKNTCENLFKELFQNTNYEIFLNNPDGKFLEVHKRVPEILGYSSDELNGLLLSDIYLHNDLQNMQQFSEKLREGKMIFETELKTKEGKVFPVELESRLIKLQENDVILTISRDISERKQIERKILNAIIETEQKERERFSKDLHDQLGNILSSMNIYCELMKSETIDYIEKENLMGYFKGLLNEAILSTKEIANNLNPVQLTKFGIVNSIHEYCNKINKTGLLKIYFSTNLKEELLSKDLEVNLYKIITELVNNTLKHASAGRVYLALSVLNNQLVLKYEDNGSGFDYEKKLRDKSSKGMGLFNISSRVAAFGGRISFESNKFIGTRVHIQTNIS